MKTLTTCIFLAVCIHLALAKGGCKCGRKSLKPTLAPTAPPTEPPTSPPTEPPTPTITKPPTSPPTEPPTSPPTEPPTPTITKPPTSPPTEPPTSPPTEPPTSPPTEPPTSTPTEPPTSTATEPPTSPPTEPPTEVPTPAPNPCPSALWVRSNDSCYLFVATNYFYSEARDFCENQTATGSNLVQIDDAAENSFLKNQADNVITPEPSTGYWIGLQNVNGVETWLPSGDAATFFDWNNNPVGDQPDSGQSCGALWKNFQYRWADIECTVANGEGDSDGRKLFALCEFEIPQKK